MKGRALLVALIVLGGCQAEPEPPERPANVPEDAVWIGGWDGGRWHRCVQAGDLFECTQWQYGDVSTRQMFRLCADADPSQWPAFIAGSPAERIPTKRGAFVLVPAGPQLVYRGNVIDEDMTGNNREDFAKGRSDLGEADLSCRTPLVPVVETDAITKP